MMGGLINAIDISAQGLSAQRAKMNTVAQNMANAPFSRELSRAATQLTRTNPEHRTNKVRLSVGSVDVSTVEHKQITDPDSNFRLVYDPTHPDADSEGFVKMPDVDIVHEMVDMMAASRAYEANTSVIASAKKMANDALEI
jgi:flagellar basal-body rod protein FlgC